VDLQETQVETLAQLVMWEEIRGVQETQVETLAQLVMWEEIREHLL
jgi:hypothetical protein